MQNFYQDVPVVTIKRELIDESRVIDYVTEQFNRLLKDHKSPYRVSAVYLDSYPADIEVFAVNKREEAPDEDDLGLSELGYEEYGVLQDVLKELLGCKHIGFPYYYFSK